MTLVHSQGEEVLAASSPRSENLPDKRPAEPGPRSSWRRSLRPPGAGLEVGPFGPSYKSVTSQDSHLQIFSSCHMCILEYTKEAILISNSNLVI